MSNQVCLNIALTREPPTEFRLFKRGDNETSKGLFVFDDASAISVLAAFAAHGLDKLPIDYDHKMLRAASGPEGGKAAGWFLPAVRNGELWATQVTWTPAAAQAIRDAEFRFVSPAAFHSDGHIDELINVAITNLPATVGQQALVAATKQIGEVSPTKPEKPNVPEKLFALLGAENEAEATIVVKTWNTNMAALMTATGTTSFDAMLTTVKANAIQAAEAVGLAAQVATLTAAAESATKADLIAKLSKEGKAPPTLHAFLSGCSVSQIEQFAAGATVVAATVPTAPGAGNVATLTDDEKRVARQLNLTDEAFLATKADLAAGKAPTTKGN